MLDKDNNPWKIESVDKVYSNDWIEVRHHDVLNPNGNPGIYGQVHYKNLAIGIIPLDNDLNTWIVGQYRFPIGKYSWEIPEGGGPLNEDPLNSAKRELKEETGIEALNWQSVLEMYTSNSVADEKAIIYVAQDLSFGKSEPEDTEELEIKKLPFGELYKMLLKGEVTDAMSIAAIFKVAWLIDNNQL